MQRTRPRLLRSAAVAMAFGLGIAACGSSDPEVNTTGATPLLPIDGGSSVGGAESAMAMDSMMMPALITFVAGDGLEAMGGDRAVYRLAPGGPDNLAAVASAAGIEGQPAQDQDSLRISGDDATVESYGGSSWNLFRDGETPGVTTVCETSSVTPDGETSAAEPDIGRCETPPVERPADLGTADEAEATARALATAAVSGLDIATVEVFDAGSSFEVQIRFAVDGLTIDGLDSYVSIGAGGRAIYGSGPLGTIETVADYPTISTTDAIDAMNAGGGFGAGPMPMGAAEDAAVGSGPVTTHPEDIEPTPPTPGAVPSTTHTMPPSPDVSAAAPPTDEDGYDSACDSDVPPPDFPPINDVDQQYPEPEPVTITLTTVAWSLTTYYSWDGSGAYIVPAYSFTGDDDGTYTAFALSDEVIQPFQGDPGGTTGTIEPDGPMPDVMPDVVEGSEGSVGRGQTEPAIAVDPGAPDAPPEVMPPETTPVPCP